MSWDVARGIKSTVIRVTRLPRTVVQRMHCSMLRGAVHIDCGVNSALLELCSLHDGRREGNSLNSE